MAGETMTVGTVLKLEHDARAELATNAGNTTSNVMHSSHADPQQLIKTMRAAGQATMASNAALEQAIKGINLHDLPNSPIRQCAAGEQFLTRTPDGTPVLEQLPQSGEHKGMLEMFTLGTAEVKTVAPNSFVVQDAGVNGICGGLVQNALKTPQVNTPKR